MRETCVFCGIVGNRPVLASAGSVFAVHDQFPVTNGHTLIIPSRHVSTWFDLTSEEQVSINKLLMDERDRLLAADQTITGFNIGINCGESAGQTVDHCHVHLIPRRDNDVAEPKGGVRWVIPDKADYWS